MLEIKKELKVRKNNLYIPITRYKLVNLRLDLETEIITIKVDFFRNEEHLFTKYFNMGKCGDTNVNELIKQVHSRIEKNES